MKCSLGKLVYTFKTSSSMDLPLEWLLEKPPFGIRLLVSPFPISLTLGSQTICHKLKTNHYVFLQTVIFWPLIPSKLHPYYILQQISEDFSFFFFPSPMSSPFRHWPLTFYRKTVLVNLAMSSLLLYLVVSSRTTFT